MIQLTEALKYGIIGLGAILAILCFYLISKEQNRPHPRQSVLKSVYIFMIFSCILLALGIVGHTNQIKEVSTKSSSGFPKGALDGRWELHAQDAEVSNNSDFKSPLFRYEGVFTFTEKEGGCSIIGYLKRSYLDTLKNEVSNEIKFEAFGIINNNYVGAEYIFSDGKRNGFGTMLASFNNEAELGDAYFLFRPSVTTIPFGLVRGKLLRIQ